MDKPILKRIFNRFLHLLARFSPGSTNFRPFLHRLRGVKIGRSVFIGDDVYLENEHPDCVEIEDGVCIGLRSTIIAHSGGLGEHGKITIQKKATIMSCCTIVCSAGQSLIIGEGAVISAGSVVSNNVAPHTLCAGPRITAVAQVTVPYTLEVTHEDFVRGLRPLSPGKKTEK